MAIASPSPSPDLIKKSAKLSEGIEANSKRGTAISTAAGTGMVALFTAVTKVGLATEAAP
jgi:hypothetical protein